MVAAAPHVWVTRAEPGAAATAARLHERGWTPLVAPLLAVRRLNAPLELEGVGAVAFTSANAVSAAPPELAAADLPVFAVGDATAAAAREAGFSRVESARGDATALAALVRRRRPDFAGDVLHPRASEPTVDLAELLGGEVRVRPLVVYETVAVPLPAEAAETWSGLAAVLLHSPKAARALTAQTRGWPEGPAVLCLSAAVAGALAGSGPRVFVADRPDETALLNLLDVRGRRGDGRTEP
ncbi:MAG TPA: uroporphyrinogen-III synthase [Caulobacteraceae bacterium]|jgi:uroporphyrinogen-III synthase